MSRRSGPRARFSLAAIVAATILGALLPASVLAAPANDDFANAKVIIGSLPYTHSMNPSDATTESNEPESECAGAEATVWYRFTPTSGGVYRVDTMGSNYNTDIAVFRGTTLANLVLIDCNHDIDFNDPGLHTSRIAFRATANTRYYFRVNGSGGTELDLRVRKVSAPGNDNYSSARTISSLPFRTNADVTNATSQPDEPRSGNCDVARATRWYKYTPATDQVVWANTYATLDHDVVLGVYTGSSTTTANQIACNDDQWFQGDIIYPSGLTWMAHAGTTYRIQVAGYEGESGDRRETPLNVERVTPEANDTFADRAEIESLPYTDTVNTRRATIEGGEPVPSCFSDVFNTAWYEHTAATADSLNAEFQAAGGGYHPGVAVYSLTGSGFGGLSEVACAGSAAVTFTPVAGTTYVFQVAATGTIALPGEFSLELGFAP